VGRERLLLTITGNKPLPHRHKQILLEVLGYLDVAYGRKRRRLGPMAVLHPLRAAALLSAASDELRLLDLLSVLLHDKYEDILPDDHQPEEWTDLEERFQHLLRRIDPTDKWYLMERLELLTRHGGKETYYAYIGRLLDHSTATPELVRVKLADRLDNTLDMRIDFQDPLDDVDFFGDLFQVLFVPTFPGYRPDITHPPPAPLNGARRLYDLFKTAITLSLVRQMEALDRDDHAAQRLFRALCVASMREAQRIVMHIFGYHCKSVDKQRSLLLETMKYCLGGGVVSVTESSEAHRLDGLFLEQFDHLDRQVREQKLQQLYQDKELMTEAALAFIVIFMSFLNDPEYFVQGVSRDGIYAEPAAGR